MQSNLMSNTIVLTETLVGKDVHTNGDANNNGSVSYDKSAAKVQNSGEHKLEIVWINVIAFVYLHLSAFYGIYLACTAAKFATFLFAAVSLVFASFGVTAGAHRLWSHKSYKANLPLRILLMIFNSMAFQNSIYEWTRDHRAHHKFTDTDGDPHNSRRGFFFSHIGWLMVRKHPDVKQRGATVGMSDLHSDGVVMFQKKYYGVLMPLICFILPTWIPVYFWDETVSNAWYVAAIMRYTLQLNGTWLVNSAAHMWGSRPYDKNISSTDSMFVGVAALGEGWHNYHHVFPWDYKAAELGGYESNWTTCFLDFFAKLGWAYDMKSVSDEMILKRIQRTGDGTHKLQQRTKDKKVTTDEFRKMLNDEHHNGHMVWGWDDQDMKNEDKVDAKIIGAKICD